MKRRVMNNDSGNKQTKLSKNSVFISSVRSGCCQNVQQFSVIYKTIVLLYCIKIIVSVQGLSIKKNSVKRNNKCVLKF